MLSNFDLGFRAKSALCSALGVIAALCSVTPAAAQNSGLESGLRAGYGVPIGDAADGADEDINSLIGGVVPIWSDLGYRASPNVFIGAYSQWGIGFVGEDLEQLCDAGDVDCSLSSHRLGAQLHYHFSPRQSLDPWLGIGFGYEWLKMDVEGSGGGELSLTTRGFELANFQGGVDLYPTDHIYLGLFVSFSLNQYGSVDAECDGLGAAACANFEQVDGDIEDKSIHNWLMLGIRGGFTGFGR